MPSLVIILLICSALGCEKHAGSLSLETIASVATFLHAGVRVGEDMDAYMTAYADTCAHCRRIRVLHAILRSCVQVCCARGSWHLVAMLVSRAIHIAPHHSDVTALPSNSPDGRGTLRQRTISTCNSESLSSGNEL